eukprot:77610-Amphidinium_carterae.4
MSTLEQSKSQEQCLAKKRIQAKNETNYTCNGNAGPTWSNHITSHSHVESMYSSAWADCSSCPSLAASCKL